MSSNLDAVMDLLLRDKTLILEIIAWEQTVHGVNQSGISDHPVGEHRIGLKCVLRTSLNEGDLLVGDEPAEHLPGLPFNIRLQGARKIFSKMKVETATENEKNVVGWLVYNPPIPPKKLSGLPTRIINESKTGSITGHGFFDDDTLRKISHLLETRPVDEMMLWVTVRATRDPTELAMTYETHDYRPTNYRWSGKGPLAVWDIAVVTKSPEKLEASIEPEPHDAREPGETPEAQIVAAIREARNSLTNVIVTVGLLVIFALGAILFLIERWTHH